MLEAKDLRIGNYVRFGHYKPHKIERGEFAYTEDYANIEDYKAIVLDEDWLSNFGFEKTWFGYEDENIEIQETENKEFLLSIKCNEYTNGKPFKYVHQLQNLYFSLTGKELQLIK